MKRFLYLFISIILYNTSFGQTTLVLKPDSINGIDAHISKLANNCLPNGFSATFADLNFGKEKTILTSMWTFGSVGCDKGTTRTLIKFSELSNIPQTAIITNVEFKLYGVNNVQNTTFPGKPSNFLDNSSSMHRVTSPWLEDSVTWNTQPTFDTANFVLIPASNSQFNWDYTINSDTLKTMIQDMVANPSSNYGFMFKLNNEISIYRNLAFASSDNPNQDLWPELIITYYIIDPKVSYSVENIDFPNDYTFKVKDNGSYNRWTINGVMVSDSSSFNYKFNPGSYKVCYIGSATENRIKKCVDICINSDTNIIDRKPVEEIDSSKNDFKLNEIEKQLNDLNSIVFPNPTNNNWILKLIATKTQDIRVSILDLNGRELESYKKSIIKGENRIEISGNSLVSGKYILQIIGKNINETKIIIKK